MENKIQLNTNHIEKAKLSIEASVFLSYMILNHNLKDEKLIKHQIDNNKNKAKRNNSLFLSFFQSLSSFISTSILTNEVRKILNYVVLSNQLDTLSEVELNNYYNVFSKNFITILSDISIFTSFFTKFIKINDITIVNAIYLYKNDIHSLHCEYKTRTGWLLCGRILHENAEASKILCPIFELENRAELSKITPKYVYQDVYSKQQTVENCGTTVFELEKIEPIYELERLESRLNRLLTYPVKLIDLEEQYMDYSYLLGYAALNSNLDKEKRIYYLLRFIVQEKIVQNNKYEILNFKSESICSFLLFLITNELKIDFDFESEINLIITSLVNHEITSSLFFMHKLTEVTKSLIEEIDILYSSDLPTDVQLTIEDRIRKIKLKTNKQA